MHTGKKVNADPDSNFFENTGSLSGSRGSGTLQCTIQKIFARKRLTITQDFS